MSIQPRQAEAQFRVWGADEVAYGPLDLDGILEWIRSRRLTSDHWVYSSGDQTWRRAGERPEIQFAFASASPSPAKKSQRDKKAAVDVLRELELFNGLTDAQIASFVDYGDLTRVPQFLQIAKKGERGDSMFIVLEGEVRAYLVVDGRECTLCCSGPGECVGEISLLDQGPRSADLAANSDTTLLRISADQFRQLLSQAPALAAPFLLSLGKTVVGRIRNTTQRYEDSVQFLGRNIPGWK